MSEAAAKQGDRIESDGSAAVWVAKHSDGSPLKVQYDYAGPIDGATSADVFVNGKPVALEGSTAENEKTPAVQPAVTSAGVLQSTVDDTASVASGSSRVFANGRAVARNGDSARTWDYSLPATPGTGREIENAVITATGDVFVGG